MNKLSWGKYALVDEVLYRRDGYAAASEKNWDLVAVDPSVEPRRREVPVGTVDFLQISPSATYRGIRLEDLIFEEDGRVTFSVWPYPRDWPADVPLERYGNPERAGDGFWIGTIAFSELADFDDGFPEEWRPFLPAGDASAG